MAFVVKMSLFHFGFTKKTQKENDKEDADAGPLAKEKKVGGSLCGKLRKIRWKASEF